ncbi:hypothetical protein HPB52_021502 [Rhipicephalus sanguineus]|uniref:Uncharacterized protein n=1 Tax=Rhipicephalus sanguineus TaxID=34632 RepID=A0A9D4QEF5_RHISA|nr:hypothetical protein HPB52_021502 [Rhipicephalus sanguineus]
MFGGFHPSAGHAKIVCKILRSEALRQARFYREALHLQIDRGPGSRSAKARKRQQHAALIEHALENKWRQEPFVLRQHKRPSDTQSSGQVHTEEGVSVPDFVQQTIALGPKFAFERQNSPAELLLMVHDVSKRAPDGENERCVSEGVDVLRRYSRRDASLPTKKVGFLLLATHRSFAKLKLP